MKKKIFTALLLLAYLLIVSPFAGQRAFAQTVSRKVMSTGSATYTGTDVQVTITMGETFIQTSQSASNIVTQGFQQPGEQIKTGSVSNSLCEEHRH